MNKCIVAIIVLVSIISIMYMNDKDGVKNIDIENNWLLYEEAKFYGIDINPKDMNIDTENIDIKRDMYIEEAKFWGLQQYN